MEKSQYFSPISKPFKIFDESIKNKVNLYLEYMKEILASGNEEVDQYILKWNLKLKHQK